MTPTPLSKVWSADSAPSCSRLRPSTTMNGPSRRSSSNSPSMRNQRSVRYRSVSTDSCQNWASPPKRSADTVSGSSARSGRPAHWRPGTTSGWRALAAPRWPKNRAQTGERCWPFALRAPTSTSWSTAPTTFTCAITTPLTKWWSVVAVTPWRTSPNNALSSAGAQGHCRCRQRSIRRTSHTPPARSARRWTRSPLVPPRARCTETIPNVSTDPMLQATPTSSSTN